MFRRFLSARSIEILFVRRGKTRSSLRPNRIMLSARILFRTRKYVPTLPIFGVFRAAHELKNRQCRRFSTLAFSFSYGPSVSRSAAYKSTCFGFGIGNLFRPHNGATC